MQIRCYHCHKPFAMNKEAVHFALDTMTASGLGHYNATCPHCRRSNRVSKDELIRAAPDWSPEKSQEESAADQALT